MCQNCAHAQNAHYMQRAIDLSLEAIRTGQGGPFGAVIVKDNHIIAEGFNRVTSLNDPTAHAEITAIRTACDLLKTFDLSGCAIYTSCEPCPMCLGAIYWARLDKIYFANSRQDAANIGFDDQFIYQELAKPLSVRDIPCEQLLASEAMIAFQEWCVKPDKVSY